MPEIDPRAEMIKTARRIGQVAQHSVKLGALGGAAYTVGRSKYLKTRQRLAKDPKMKRYFAKKDLATRKNIARNVSRGAALGFGAKFAVAPIAFGAVKGQNMYHMAAHKAGRFKRRRERAGDFAGGFDPSGFKIVPRKAPKPKKVSGLLKAKNEDKMTRDKLMAMIEDRMEARPKSTYKTRFRDLETGQKAAMVGMAAGAALGGGHQIRRAIKAKKAQRAAKTPRAAKMHKKAFRKALAKTVPAAVAGGITGSFGAAFPFAVRDVSREHKAASGKYYSALHPSGKQGYNPKHTTADERRAAARKAVSKKAKKILDFDFRGHGRSLGKNEAREELIGRILEVFDDTYSAGVFGKERQNIKQAKLIHMARSLKKARAGVYRKYMTKPGHVRLSKLNKKHWRHGNYALDA